MESLAFWPVFGLIVTVFIWASSRERIERQKTLQRMLERNEDIDEELVNKLLERRGFSCKPGDAYRYLRAIGAFGMIVSIPVGALAFAAVDGALGGIDRAAAIALVLVLIAGRYGIPSFRRRRNRS